MTELAELATLDSKSLGTLLPMYLHLTAQGRILSVGPTLQRLIAGQTDFDRLFSIDRPKRIAGGFAALLPIIARGERIALRLCSHPQTVLRGHGALLPCGNVMVNLGFGVGLSDAVRTFHLTDADFAPSELAMELLFLHEANSAVQSELARFNLHLEQARKAAEVQAYTDPLTGLYNRRGLEVALNAALREADRLPFALGHLDLDHFKRVNDDFGHAAGDAVLQRVARVLRQETRASDTVARVGGDEFVLILTSPGSTDVLKRLGRRIISRIEEPIGFEDHRLSVSASIGITESAGYAEPNARAILSDADNALYFAKKAGRGRVEIFGRKGGEELFSS